MIADEIVAQLYRQGGSLASLMAGAHCVNVPFGIHGCDPKLDALLPMKGGYVNAEWARPPFPNLIIVGDGPVSFTAEDYRKDGEPFGPTSPEIIAKITAEIAATRNRGAIVVFDLGDAKDLGHGIWWRDAAQGDEVAWMVFALKLGFGENGVVVPSQWGFIAGLTDGRMMNASPEGKWMERLFDEGFPELLGVTVLPAWRNTVQTSLGPMELNPRFVAGRLLPMVATTFALMNCQNVIQVPQQPIRQLRRAAQRTGGPRPFVVHHLHVRPLKKVRQTERKGEAPSYNLALHWVRGHFKTYTPERPLLGRVAGTFWWTPHLAGDVHDGVVVKDYTVEAP